MAENMTERERLMSKRRAGLAARQRAAGQTAATPTVTVSAEEIQVMATPAVRPSTSTAVALPMADQSRVITEQDVVIPKLKMAQSMSKVVQEGEVKLGHWYHTSMNRDLGTEVVIIPVDLQKTRSYFVQGAGVMCRSFDFVTGQGSPGGYCEGTVEEQSTLPASQRGCALRYWGERDATTGRSEPPVCGENYNFTCVIITDPTNPDSSLMRAVLTFRKTGIPAAKKIVTYKVEEDFDWTDMVIRVKINSKSSPRGTYQTPEVEWVGTSDAYPKAYERAQKLAQIVNSNMIRATLDADPE